MGKQKGFSAVQSIIVLLVVIAVAAAGFVFWSANKSNNDSTASKKPTEPGVIAVLGDDLTFKSSTPGQENQNVTGDTAPTAVAGVANSGAISFDLPDGWNERTTSSTKDPCSDDPAAKNWVKTEYERKKETIILYINGNPNGCDGDEIADVYLDFDFISNTDIKVDTSKFEQCSKEENRTCPKGDGRLSIFIGNEADPSGFAKHPVTGDSYFFEIIDTDPDTDLHKSVKAFASIIERFNIN